MPNSWLSRAVAKLRQLRWCCCRRCQQQVLESNDVENPAVAAEFTALPNKLPFDDAPRIGKGVEASLIAFYYPDRDEPWDRLCKCGFLGNFYKLEEPLHLKAPKIPGKVHKFKNAEAAFQALKFWDRAAEFETLSGSEAFHKKRSLSGQEDFTYGKYGSNWEGMRNVLRAKFRQGTHMAVRLQLTGDAYLLEHNAKSGRDKIWSDNSCGDGQNWLGLQLMLTREELRPQPSAKPWTEWISQHVDLKTGKVDKVWQDVVAKAVSALNRTMQRDLRSIS